MVQEEEKNSQHLVLTVGLALFLMLCVPFVSFSVTADLNSLAVPILQVGTLRLLLEGCWASKPGGLV